MSDVVTLILKHANKNRLGAVDWGPNDFDVCEGDRCIVSDARASDSGFQELPARLPDDGGISILVRRIRWQNQAH